MQHSNSAPDRRSGRSLAVRIGALTAALSLMLAGGVAVAASASAKDNPNVGNGNSQGNANANAPGQNDNNGNAIHGDNGGGNGGGPGSGTGNTGNNGQNSDNGAGGTGHLRIYICHATRSYDNPYVYIVTDVSSVDELLRVVSGKGNGHGDHLGEVFDPAVNVSGNNWGDVISAVVGENGKTYYPGYNLNKGIDPTTGCGTKTNVLTPKSVCSVPTDGVYTQQTFGPAAPYDTQEKIDAAYAAAIKAGQKKWTGSAADCSTPCTENCTTPYTANDGAAFCDVQGGQYGGIESVEVYNEPGDTQANAQAAADKRVFDALTLKANGDNIIPPHKAFAGYNWNAKTQARFNAGCSPNQTVISAALPATVPAAGKPNPGKVGAPAAATMPGSVNAGGGSSAPSIPLWALALMVVGAIGAAASGAQLMGSRK